MTQKNDKLAGLSREERVALFERLRKRTGGAAAPQAIPRRPADAGPAPLSFAQQRLWFLDRLQPGDASYNLVSAVVLAGELEPGALGEALQAVVDRHESLRTTFTVPDAAPGAVGAAAEPVQVVAPSLRILLPLADLSGLPEDRRRAEDPEAWGLLEEEVRRPFDLAAGPLLRLLLLRLAPDRHVLCLTMHHIVSDGWSLGLFIDEMATFYAAFSRRMPATLPELPIQYPDFAVWQRGWLRGEVLEKQIDYWRQQLAGAPAALELPTDRPRPALLSSRGAYVDLRFSLETSRRLQALSARERVTPFVVFLAVYQALLHRWTGQEELSVGTAVAGRNRAEVAGLIGFFINALVLRGDLSGNPSFLQLLGRARTVAMGAMAHQELPFDKLVEELRPERDPSRTPFFQAMLVLQNTPPPSADLGKLRIEPLSLGTGAVKFDLSLSLQEEAADGVFLGGLGYSTDLFDGTTALRLMNGFERLLAAALEDPERPVAELDMLADGERQQTVQEWNDTRAAYSLDVCLHELVEAQVDRTPGAVAVEQEGIRLTYAELEERANRLARHLRRLGVRQEEVVALCAERSPELVVGMLGVIKAGAAWLNLDPSYPEERLAAMAEDGGARLLLTQEALLPRIPTVAAGRSVLALASLIEGEGPGERRAERVPSGATPDNLAYILFTSGSTGRPKGVMAPHRGVCNRLLWSQWDYQLDGRDAVLQKASIAFDFAVFETFAPLIAGARLVLARPKGQRDPVYLMRALAEHRITITHFPPAMLAVFLDQDDAELKACTATVRVVFSGGETLTPELRDRFLRRVGVPLHNEYGPTECSIDVTREACRLEPSLGQNAHRVPLGRLIDNMRGYVVDRGLRPVPLGVAGELVLSGDGLSRGYAAHPGMTAERFIPDPFAAVAGERLYRTGDLVRWLPDGTLEFLGRIDRQVKVRGIRVELGEVEAALLALPGVLDAAVLVREERPGDRRLVACVATGAASGLGFAELEAVAAELRRGLQRRLPEPMIPGSFVLLDALPLTPNSKVDRRALAALAAQASGAGVRAHATGDDGNSAPRTPTEELLAGLWAEVLGIEPPANGAPPVRRLDDFFQLGGHSLLATQLASRIRQAFSLELPLRSLFENPTLADLAERIDEARLAGEGLGRAAEPEPILPAPRDRPIPLSFAQERLWFLDSLRSGSAYNVPLALRLEGEVRPPLLEAVLREVVRRHEALRTTFRAGEDGPVQVIADEVAVSIPVIDLSGLPPAERDRETRFWIADDVSRPFDLERGPLLRAALLRQGPAEHALLFDSHHIVSDGWSMGVLVREVTELYRAALEGRPSPLPELPVQYADFAVWQRSWLSGEVLERQMGYWRERLAGAPVLDLPTDHPRPAVQSFHGDRVDFDVDPEVTRGLRRLSQKHGATLFMALLAAFAAWLSRATGQDDLVVGTPIANRNRKEIEGLIGFFVNTLVLRLDLSGDPPVSELLDRVRKTALEAYTYQDLPFERLVEELRPERHLSHNPLFQVMFALQNAPGAAIELPGLALSSVPFEVPISKFDLVPTFVEVDEGLAGSLELSTDLFEVATVQRMAGHLQRLLAGMAADPGLRVSELPLLTEAEQRQLQEWSGATRAPETPRLALDLFEEQAARAPEAEAVTFEGSEREILTYGELDRRAEELAGRLRELEVGPSVLVGLCVERSVDLAVGILGIWKAGGAYVPFDPAQPASRLAFLLEDSAVPVLVTQERVAGSLPPHQARTVFVEHAAGAPSPTLPRSAGEGATAQILHSAQDDGAVANKAAGPEDSEAEGLRAGGAGAPSPAQRGRVGEGVSTLAYAIYTSGTTGRPKGVLVEQGSLAATLAATRALFGFQPGERMLVVAPLSFDIFLFELLSPLTTGGTAVLLPLRPAPDLGQILGLLRGTAHFHAVPALMRQVVDAVRGRPDAAPAGLRTLFVGGDVVPAELLADLREAFPASGAWELYGPTEGTILCSAWEVPPAPTRSLLGRPFAGACVTVRDRHGRLVPAGVPGEIWIGGPGVARGYLRQEELTAEKFVLGEDGERHYRTGDRARWRPDGELEFLGRLDQQVKVRGFRIELGEIESVLARHPAVREAVAVAREDVGGKRLAAYVVADPGAGLKAAELRRLVQSALPDYMVPSAIVLLDALPLTAHGKVDRDALPAPEPERAAGDGAAGPATPTEETLAAIWGELLGLERVGREDDFFALGGHSLLATQVASRLRDLFGVELPVRALFEEPTLAGLAAWIDREAGATLPQRPPLRPAPREGQDVRLSFAQERMWFLYRLDPASPVYNMPVALRLLGALDPGALAGALREVARRHEALRTTFPVVHGEALQRIAPEPATPWIEADLRGLPEAACEEELSRLAVVEAERPFALAEEPPIRATLLRLGPDDSAFFLTLHHIASDGWSMGILVNEVATAYGALSRGERPRLRPLPVQYADFALWQRSWLRGEALEAELAYWREKLAGESPLLRLPLDRPRPPVLSTRGGKRFFHLPRELGAGLDALARREGATLFIALLAGFQALLSRYSGQDDIWIGSPVANRNRSEIEGLIGFFVNTLVFRGDLSGNPPFRALLAQLRDTALEAYAHQDVPFERLVEELRPERDPSRSPLFLVMFALQNAPLPPVNLGDLRLEAVDRESGGSRFDLTVSLMEVAAERGGGIEAMVEYNSDLFDPATVDRLGAHYRHLLAAALASPERALEDLSYLGEEERYQLVMSWSGARGALAGEETLHGLFTAQAERTPHAPALLHGTESLTYGELAARAGRLARRLRTLGVGPEDRVAISVPRSPEMVVGVLGILLAGGAYVPLDPSYPAERLRLILEDSGAAGLVTLSGIAADLAAPGGFRLELDADAGAGAEDGVPLIPGDPGSLAYVIYTSGSTGRPKGVLATHRGAAGNVRAVIELAGQGPGKRCPQLSTLSFDVSVLEIFATLGSGACLCLVRDDGLVMGESLSAALHAMAVTTAILPVSVLSTLAPDRAAGGPEELLFPLLRTLVVGGERCTEEVVRRWAPGRRFFNAYGPTETSICVTSWEAGLERLPLAAAGVGPLPAPPIGRPFAGTRVYVVDRAGDPAPQGVPGELLIGGIGVARGYLGRPERTAESFVPDPFAAGPEEGGGRLYRTGDLCRWRLDGNLEILGRIDSQVKVRGYRIELGEVEAAIARHPEVRAAVVLAREDQPGDRRLVAYVVPRGDRSAEAPPPAAVLRAWLGESLPAHMIPGFFMLLDDLPMTANGKVDRARLPAPGRSEEAFVPPSTETEKVLAAIWAEALGLERVGANDNFFELGGHSLLLPRVQAEVREARGRDFPLFKLLEHPTLAALAAYLDQEEQEDEEAREAGEEALAPAGDSHTDLSR